MATSPAPPCTRKTHIMHLPIMHLTPQIVDCVEPPDVNLRLVISGVRTFVDLIVSARPPESDQFMEEHKCIAYPLLLLLLLLVFIYNNYKCNLFVTDLGLLVFDQLDLPPLVF